MARKHIEEGIGYLPTRLGFFAFGLLVAKSCLIGIWEWVVTLKSLTVKIKKVGGFDLVFSKGVSFYWQKSLCFES